MKNKNIYSILIFAFITLSKLSFGQVIYMHNFGTATFTAVNPYTVTPTTIDANLSGSQWVTSVASGFTTFAGTGGGGSQALSISNSSATPTYSLSYTVAPGFLCDITNFSFWRQRSGTGAPNWTLTVNGVTTIGAGTTPTVGITTGTLAVSNAANGLSGTVNVILQLSGASGTGSFRLDDFTLYGTVYSSVICTPPTIQASSFSASSIGSSSATVSWTSGNGGNVIVLARQSSTVNASPSNGATYTANSLFASGQQIGTGNYVVYNGIGNSVNVTGLNSGTDYYFSVFEYDITIPCYLKPALTGSLTTVAVPTSTNCLQIKSILVAACGAPESYNEMVYFKNGPNPLPINQLSIAGAPASGVYALNKWPNNSNSWFGLVQNATTASNVATINGTITSCGHVLEPPQTAGIGIIPPFANVILVGHQTMNPLANSFANLTDTVYMIFQAAATSTSGNFTNTGAGTRGFVLIDNLNGCTSNSVTYTPALLSTGGGDGDGVSYDNFNNITYFNSGCQAPYVPFTVAVSPNQTICYNAQAVVTATPSGVYNSVTWSGGTGVFSSPSSLTTSYTPGALETGTVQLQCSITRTCALNSFSASATTTISITSLPIFSLAATNGYSLCPSVSTVMSYSVTNAANAGVITPGWSSPAGAGTTYTVSSPSGTASVTYSLNLTNVCGTTLQTFTVYPLASPTVTLSATTPTACVGSTVSLTATGNTTNFSWTNPVSTNSTVTLTANTTTTGIVTSTNSCGSDSKTYTLTVTQNPVLTVDNPNPTLCAGQSATITATSSTGTYTWMPDAVNTNSIVVNSAGTHTVSTSNVCNSASVAVNVVVNATPVLTISTTSVSLCAGGQTSAILSLVGSTGTYSWSTGATTSTIAITTPGVYTATVDAGLCGVKDASISIGTLITPTISVVPTSTLLCDGATATLTASSNLTNFSWSNGATNTPTIAVTATNLYTVSVSNACGVPSASVNILADVTPTLNLVSNTPTLCPSQSATLTVTGGSVPSYTWSNSASTGSVVTTNGGTVSVSYTNVCGIDTKSITVSVIPNPTVTLASSTYTACPGDVINIIANSSEGNYSWSGSANTTATLSLIASTSITGIVTTTNACTNSTANYTITVIDAPTIFVDFANISLCTGQSATVTATSSIGNYTWMPGGITTNTLVVNSINVYTVTTSNACYTVSATSTVAVNSSPTLTITSTTPTLCLSGQTATLSLSGSVGSYTWNDASTNDSLMVNSPGVYTATVTTASCGTTSASFTINAIDTPTISVASTSTLLCNGASATLTASSNMTNYSWSDGSTNTNSIVVNTSGIYTVGVSNGCGVPTASINILTDAIPTLNLVSNTPTLCPSQSATLTVTGGSVPSYTWSNSASTGSVVTTNGGTVSVSYSNTCGTDTKTISVTITPTPTISLTSSSSLLCNGASATLTASNNMANEIWSNSATNTPTIVVNATGLYTVGVSNGCGSPTASINIQTDVTPVISLTSNTTTICPNETATLTVTGGTAPYVWSNSASTGSVVTTNGGTVIVTNTNGCGTGTASAIVNVVSINASISANPTSGIKPVVVDFTNNSTSATTYLWNFGNGLSANTQTVSSQTYSVVGTHTVYLLITNGTCTDIDSLTISVLNEEPTLIIPNVFTPNNDSVNDVFKVTGFNIIELNCTIFDRWGLQMFYWDGIKNGWDGKTGGEKVPDGTYFYIINAKDIDGKEIKRQGHISLFR